MNIKAIIFDNAGVLIDEKHETWAEAIANYYNLDADFVYQKYSRAKAWPFYKHGKISEDEFWKMGNECAKKDLDIKVLKEIVRENRVPIKEVTQLIPKLSKKYLLGIINNEGREWDNYSHEKEDFYKHFSVFSPSYEACTSKPERRIYEILIYKLKRKKIKPTQSIYIDDRQNNLDAGEKFGFSPILYTNIRLLKRDLKKFNIRLKR